MCLRIILVLDNLLLGPLLLPIALINLFQVVFGGLIFRWNVLFRIMRYLAVGRDLANRWEVFRRAPTLIIVDQVRCAHLVVMQGMVLVLFGRRFFNHVSNRLLSRDNCTVLIMQTAQALLLIIEVKAVRLRD